MVVMSAWNSSSVKVPGKDRPKQDEKQFTNPIRATIEPAFTQHPGSVTQIYQETPYGFVIATELNMVAMAIDLLYHLPRVAPWVGDISPIVNSIL